ncbi:hypothetical protein FE236_00445 [Mariprofundus erugo]|uniref:hypothetical protein n=1 Tax=Mariprofundus erugo TaxID=2528639 RepID=UPI0010FE9C3D|nr:hypothetical protein [Mariprofundus erugo]TLS78263.1 hypothetical protein FE236_00445 [Mariprofundus erugo]
MNVRFGVFKRSVMAVMAMASTMMWWLPAQAGSSDETDISIDMMGYTSMHGGFEAKFNGHTGEFRGEYRWAGSAGGNDLSDLKQIANEWSGVHVYGAVQGYMLGMDIACRNSATAADEALVRRDRYNTVTTATISGRIRGYQKALLDQRLVVLLEDGCRIDFDVAPLTPAREASATSMPVGSDLFEAAKVIQHGDDKAKTAGNLDYLWGAILRDKRIDSMELAFLEQIYRGGGELRLQQEGGDNSLLFRSYWQPDEWSRTAHQTDYGPLHRLPGDIRKQLANSELYAQLEQAWRANPADMEAMVTAYESGALHAELINEFLAMQFKPLVEQSNQENKWNPLISQMGIMLAGTKQMTKERAAKAKHMIYWGIRGGQNARDKSKAPNEIPEVMIGWLAK